MESFQFWSIIYTACENRIGNVPSLFLALFLNVPILFLQLITILLKLSLLKSSVLSHYPTNCAITTGHTNFNLCNVATDGSTLISFIYNEAWGAWIAEWYHTWLWSPVCCAMLWAVSLSHSDDKFFFGPKHYIYAFFMILFGLFDTIICLSNLSC